jgi:hypothetical protein
MSKKKNNSYLDDFEGMIVRMDYLTRSTYDEAAYNEFKYLCKITADEMFRKYGTFYRRISYHQDDVEQLCRCYLISYLSLYSLKNNEKTYDRFAYKYLKIHDCLPPDDVLHRVERNSAIKFLRQQCINSVLTVNRKSRNVICGNDSIVYFAYTKESIPVDNVNTLIEHSEKYNYRKVTLKEFKMLQDKNGRKNNIVDEDGYEVIVIQNLAVSDGVDDSDHLYVVDNKYSPDTIQSRMDEEREMSRYEREFDKEENKVLKLKSFINTHRKDSRYKEEVGEARRILKSYDIV